MIGEGKKAPEVPETPTNMEVWPPSSPDCNPVDYYVWGVAEGDVNTALHRTKESLIAKISREEVTLAATSSAAAWRRPSPLTKILLNKFILQYLINIVTKNYISTLFLSMFLWEREKK